jgi:hypothetical protein
MSTQQSSVTDLGIGLVAALAQRDFPRLADTLTPDVRMRALIPPGPIELSGAEAAAAKFSSWFGDAEEFELIRSGSDTVADRLHVFYRLRVKKPGDQRKIVEQHLLCALDDDRITALDLICTGFRPDEGGAHSRPTSRTRIDTASNGRPQHSQSGGFAKRVLGYRRDPPRRRESDSAISPTERS